MPFTPFHFGPGIFGKSLASRHFSWTAFAASQVVIDFETLYYLLQRTYPIHRFFHTFLGATIAGLATGLLLIGTTRLSRKFMPTFSNFVDGLRPSLQAELSEVGLIVGGLIGGISHPFFDGIMHKDVRPFLPWSDANPLLRLIELDLLHLGCLFLGIVGLIITILRVNQEGNR